MRAWAAIAIGIVVAAVALLGAPFIQSQKDLQATRAKITELESLITNLKTELDAANQSRTQLQGALEEANTEIEKRQSEIERLGAELEKALNLAKQTKAPNQPDNTGEPSGDWQPQ
jgi:peptidoglycan hydrolase CwlO-like protein